MTDMLQDKRFDFTILENDIVRDTEKFDKNEVLAYIAICYHADKAGTCFPSYEGIARIMRTSRSTAIKAIQGLVEKGVIKLENRKADDKKKELTSNLYTLVSNKYWEQVQLENRKYMVTKGADYKKRYAKGQATKIANKNAKEDKKNTPDSTAIEPSVHTKNNSFVNNSIAQDSVKNKEESYDKFGYNMTNNQEMSQAFKVRMEMLNKAKIKSVPYESERELIESLDLEMLQQAIDITVEKSTFRSWNYLLSTFDTISVRKNNAKTSETTGFTPNFKQRYQNNNLKGGLGMARCNLGGKYFEDWDAKELEQEILRKQGFML